MIARVQPLAQASFFAPAFAKRRHLHYLAGRARRKSWRATGIEPWFLSRPTA
jgi:hypothetical protein